jgi:O-antigen/teichoic acid export membrane protein
VGKRDRARIMLILMQGTLLVAAIAAIIAVLVMLLSEVIVSVYGPSYKSASGVLSILAISSIFSALSGIFKNILFACDKVWAVVGAQLTMGIVLCSATLLLAARGATGLALAYILGWSSLLVCEVLMSIPGMRSIRQSASSTLPEKNAP